MIPVELYLSFFSRIYNSGNRSCREYKLSHMLMFGSVLPEELMPTQIPRAPLPTFSPDRANQGIGTARKNYAYAKDRFRVIRGLVMALIAKHISKIDAPRAEATRTL